MQKEEKRTCANCRYYEEDNPTALYWPCNECVNYSKHWFTYKAFPFWEVKNTDTEQNFVFDGDIKDFMLVSPEEASEYTQPNSGEDILDLCGDPNCLKCVGPCDDDTHTKHVDIGGIKDSGTRTEFSTGAVRDGRESKGRFDLLPVLSMFRLAKHYERGCLKYGDRNWEKGIPISKYMDSAIRHLFKYILGMRDEHHLASALWNVAGAMETLDRIALGLLPQELDDLPYSFRELQMEELEALLEELL